MSSKENKSREEVLAAREAKKLAKQKPKNREPGSLTLEEVKAIVKERKKSISEISKDDKPVKERKKSHSEQEQKSKDEVDKSSTAALKIKPTETVAPKVGQPEKDREQVQAERAAKKVAKQAQKKGKAAGDSAPTSAPKVDMNMTVKDVVEALRDIKEVANEVKEITAEVKALDLNRMKDSDGKQVFTTFYCLLYLHIKNKFWLKILFFTLLEVQKTINSNRKLVKMSSNMASLLLSMEEFQCPPFTIIRSAS